MPPFPLTLLLRLWGEHAISINHIFVVESTTIKTGHSLHFLCKNSIEMCPGPKDEMSETETLAWRRLSDCRWRRRRRSSLQLSKRTNHPLGKGRGGAERGGDPVKEQLDCPRPIWSKRILTCFTWRHCRHRVSFCLDCHWIIWALWIQYTVIKKPSSNPSRDRHFNTRISLPWNWSNPFCWCFIHQNKSSPNQGKYGTIYLEGPRLEKQTLKTL